MARAHKRIRARYTGDVQGVGFRYTAAREASSHGLTGWVMNLDDGSVEMVCEGAQGSIDAFLARIDELFKDGIRDRDLSWGAATGEFESFGIRF